MHIYLLINNKGCFFSKRNKIWETRAKCLIANSLTWTHLRTLSNHVIEDSEKRFKWLRLNVLKSVHAPNLPSQCAVICDSFPGCKCLWMCIFSVLLVLLLHFSLCGHILPLFTVMSLDDYPLTYCHPKVRVYIWISSWYCTLYNTGFEKA